MKVKVETRVTKRDLQYVVDGLEKRIVQGKLLIDALSAEKDPSSWTWQMGYVAALEHVMREIDYSFGQKGGK